MASIRNDDPPVFSVGANSDKQPIARAGYRIYGKVESKDFTVKTEKATDNENRPYYNIGVTASADVTYYYPLFSFQNPETKENAGTIQFKWVHEKAGFLTVSYEQLSLMSFGTRGILAASPNGCSWLEAPSEDKVFGWKNGWRWFPLKKRKDPCTGEDVPGSSDKVWKKNGKILLDRNEAVITGDDCPCGEYALFAFVSYSYNHDTGVVDYCRPSVDVQACEIYQGKIWAHGRCFQIGSVTPNQQVSYDKSCTGCFMQCDKWDENYENCLHETEYCMDCSEIFVYGMSNSYKDYRSFCAFFYGGCEIEPDKNGKYPDIFEWSSDNRQYMTGTASNCASSYWQPKAYARYRPRALFKLKTYTWELKMHPSSYEPEGEEGNYHMKCNAIAAEYKDANAEIQWKYYCYGGRAWWEDDCGYGSGCWRFESATCCETWENYESKLDEVNSFFKGRSKSAFYVTEAIQEMPSTSWGYDDSNCFSFEYYSQYIDYTESWGDIDRYNRYGKIKVEKAESTHADAKGVVLIITRYMENGTNKDGCQNSDGKRTYLAEDEEVTLNFGEELEFELCDNLKDYVVTNKDDHHCDEDCKGGTFPSCGPRGGCTGQTLHCDVLVKSYVF